MNNVMSATSSVTQSAFGLLSSTAETVSKPSFSNNKKSEIVDKLIQHDIWDLLKLELKHLINSQDHIIDTAIWYSLRSDLIEIAEFQLQLEEDRSADDSFGTYAELYDEVIGKPCHDSFMRKYIDFVFRSQECKLEESTFLSIGCGTGIVEQQILQNHPIKFDNLLGIDLSESMIRVSSDRIKSKVQNIMDLAFSQEKWDFTFTGLNVFQYLDDTQYDAAIKIVADITQKNGLFFGDFITPDHVRWYPNIIHSDNVISLRQPAIVERNFQSYQQSEIININRLRGGLNVTYEGKHLRYLPSLQKVRSIFCKYFSGAVHIYDALSLVQIPEAGETTPSTRYLIVARQS